MSEQPQSLEQAKWRIAQMEAAAKKVVEFRTHGLGLAAAIVALCAGAIYGFHSPLTIRWVVIAMFPPIIFSIILQYFNYKISGFDAVSAQLLVKGLLAMDRGEMSEADAHIKKGAKAADSMDGTVRLTTWLAILAVVWFVVGSTILAILACFCPGIAAS